MIRRIFSFRSRQLNYWFLVCIVGLMIQMYLNTGTLSAYAATLENPTLYEGYYVNFDWPHYVANYKFITGESATEWELGFVLRRQLLYVTGYPLFLIFGFFAGSMITILLCILFSMFFFLKFIEKDFGIYSAKIALLLLCSYSGIMYWIGSPFVQNLVMPLCLWIYLLMHKMKNWDLKFNIIALFIIGVLFTGYDLLPLFAPGIILFILFNRRFKHSKRILISGLAIIAFVLPQLMIRYWIILRGADPDRGNTDTYRIIYHAYLNIFNQLPEWWLRVHTIPGNLARTYFYSNFFIIPVLFIICWLYGRLILKFRMNLVERCLLFSVLFLFLLNNMTPPYEGEWQMWGDWIARIYQASFIIYLMYIVRLAGYIYTNHKLKTVFNILISITVMLNIIINTGGLYASPLTSYVYAHFYKHGRTDSYRRNLLYYGARPLGFPEHYETETK